MPASAPVVALADAISAPMRSNSAPALRPVLFTQEVHPLPLSLLSNELHAVYAWHSSRTFRVCEPACLCIPRARPRGSPRVTM